jgi:Neuraminidase (sialidase)
MTALALLIAGFIAVIVDLPYKEMAVGEHYNCNHLEQYADASPKEWEKIADYCSYDMYDMTNENHRRIYGPRSR